jgi:hypothetical protein
METNAGNDIVEIKESATNDWLSRSGVTGMDVGFKYVGGKRTADVAIRLFVRKKIAKVADEERFPKMLGNFQTDVIEREFKPASLPDYATYNPMVGGVQLFSPWYYGPKAPPSTISGLGTPAHPGTPAHSGPISGHGPPHAPDLTLGAGTTAGMFVRDNSTGRLMILGTFHGTIAPNSPIYQPAGGDQIGFLIRGGHNLTPRVDADIISFDAPRGRHFSITQLDPAVRGMRKVGVKDLGTRVSKRGFWTGLTHGILEGVEGTTFDGYDYDGYMSRPVIDYQGKHIYYKYMLSFVVDEEREPYYFDPDTKQLLFAHEGDSGSVVIDSDTKEAIALLSWAGPGGGDFSRFASGGGPPIPLIMSSLDVTPVFQGAVLQENILLTSDESFAKNHPFDNGVWDLITSGRVELPVNSNGQTKSFHWTLKNIFQQLRFRATVIGFDQPHFSWSITDWNPKGKQLKKINDFNQDGDVTFSIRTPVRTYDPTNPIPPTTSIMPVTLQFIARHAASYTFDGTFAELVSNPTAVLGSVFLTVEVAVRSQSAAKLAMGLGAIPPPSQSIDVTLDTQLLSYKPL